MADYLDTESLPPLQLAGTISSSSSSAASSEPTTPTLTSGDPLSKLWTICRRGSPLCTLFNALNPESPLKVDHNPNLNQVNSCKASVYHFIVGCRNQLKFPEEDLFTITDLYQDDTNGFVKVVNTINKILTILEERGVICVRCPNRNSDPNAPKDTRDKVVLELLETERKYVQDLEVLQNYMRELQQQKILSPDTVHYLFGNLNSLVDFQRRFLIQLEEIAEKPAQEQRLGHLFVQMEEAFAVYEPYCANYYSAQDLVVQEAPKLEKLADILTPTYELPSMLIKPVQRICKYPLLIGQLIKSTKSDWPHYVEMEEGLESIKRVAEKVNETQRKHENIQVVEDLKKRVDDWKGQSIEGYGSLLLQDKLHMSSTVHEREMHVFFFEKALLICKESKDSTMNKLTRPNAIYIRRRRHGSLQPKGLIFTSRVIGIHNKSQDGTWTLLVEWKNNEVDQFTLRFRNEEQLKLWETTLNKTKSPVKSNVPNTHLVSMPIPSTPTHHLHSDSASFIDNEDEEEDDDSYEEEDDEYAQRMRSNSVSAQLFSGFPGRPKMPRNNSSDASTLLKMGAGRPFNVPGMNLMPLPRTSQSTVTQSSSPPIDHSNVYPASPPPSNPSSPTSSSRVPSASSSSRQRRGEDTLADIASKFMGNNDVPTPGDEYRQFNLPPPPPINRSQSHSAAPPQHGLGVYPAGQPPLPIQHTRLRSQSSPNIHKNQNTNMQWDDLPQMPFNSRTLYRTPPSPLDSPRENGVRAVASIPRLSDVASSQSLQSQIDRVVSAVPLSPGAIKIKLVCNDGNSVGNYAIVAAQEIGFTDLMEKVEKKIGLDSNLKPNGLLRLKYQDEDGDHITINSDDDVQMAFESRGRSNTVSLFVSI
ncbi:hypothetical protein DFQ28_005884 [Apophysomyces sp. BC1034]|nr:hypothetical protein DFQ30_003967 [Apophysomyces sp. BC1015]KAG0181665.1 hypothetical protein DFQ29_007541 [Apophysomyces sp. BC1021]KAG0193266.1 hypothetical protein DFQ28_005884 [Apophysomyces sp. BC1034]